MVQNRIEQEHGALCLQCIRLACIKLEIYYHKFKKHRPSTDQKPAVEKTVKDNFSYLIGVMIPPKLKRALEWVMFASDI